MDEKVLLPVYLLVFYAGYLLPIPSVILAWREWVKTTRATAPKQWRRAISTIAVVLLSAGLMYGIALAVSEDTGFFSQQFYYGSWEMRLGELGSVAIIACSVLPKARLEGMC